MSKTLKFTSVSNEPIVIYEDVADEEHFHRTIENNKEILKKCDSKCSAAHKPPEEPEMKTQKSVSFTEREHSFEETLEIKRDELELKISRLDIEESVIWDECKTFQHEIEKIESALEAFLQYADAVSLEAKARHRLCNQLSVIFNIDNFVINNEQIFNALQKTCHGGQIEQDTAFKQTLMNALQSRLGMAEHYKEYENRKHDFRLACGNFKRLLSTASLNERQLENFSAQHQKISDNFTHCRYVLFKKMPDGMETGVHIFLDSIKEITRIIERSCTEMRDLLDLFNLMDALEVNPEGFG